MPGSTGWTAGDLDAHAIVAAWDEGAFELIDGVVAEMAAALFAGSGPMFELMSMVRTSPAGGPSYGRFGVKVDLVIDESHVLKADAAWLSRDDWARQKQSAAKSGRGSILRTRLLIPPTLVIESLSPGHERHDAVTKRDLYARFGVQNYWLLDGHARTLDCLVLDGGTYRVDVAGRDAQTVRPRLFTPLAVDLGALWIEE